MQQINLKSMFHTMQLVLPHMVAQGRGKVVNISSVTFHVGMAMLSHYVASKGGVIGLTRSVAREMGEHNIHVNCITPGAMKTLAEAKVLSDEQAQGNHGAAMFEAADDAAGYCARVPVPEFGNERRHDRPGPECGRRLGDALAHEKAGPPRDVLKSR